MKSKLSLIPIFVLFLLLSCKGNSNRYVYSDGEYNAEINYYNPKTGSKSTYTLKIEIEDDKLVKIYWSNGGWLDNSHFTPPDISKGIARFTSDKGYRYLVTILDYEVDNSDNDNTCPICGESKYFADDYCGDCLKKESDDERIKKK
ncbi:hypothetical protein CLV62_10472 [Dysgonomonas alginatilytica]|uniref:Uncharacterized protein n=1 Tax=Dysgonomonas alginatilytica TaxID=1605892 RepID=A0A2V3PYE9_9BACT|nr:hypothetical protein [Dysgonomonas alginatilytica]PXV66812.1 hypothetical protein CLV62_10472 [Dysgonomonas alginatilytica]